MIPGLVIGHFFECSGLEMVYDIEDYAEGGSAGAQHRLRGHLRFPNLVLRRGMTREDPLLEWFRASEEAGARPTVTVAVLDHAGNVVRHWAFAEAWPVGWRGPVLHAGSATLATETLEIAHAGLVPTTIPTAGASASSRRAPARGFERARLEIEGGETIVCWFNPQRYSIARRQTPDDVPHRGGVAGIAGDDVGVSATAGVGGAAARELTVDVLFDASDQEATTGVRDICERLFCAMDPSAGRAGDHAREPAVTFAWGDALRFTAVLRTLHVRYTRFRSDGMPLRAHVGLTLVESAPPFSPPTSVRGTPAVRAGWPEWREPRTHVLRLGDTLQSIAHAAYGDHARWRLIAEANSIDDPLRLPRFGTVLQVPPPDSGQPLAPSEEVDQTQPAATGLGFPITVDDLGHIAVRNGEVAIRDAIVFLLVTTPGERLGRPDFGCDLAQFVHEPVDGRMIGRVQAEVRDALEHWEPRISVLRIDCAVDHHWPEKLAINISYAVRATGERGRLTHRFSTLGEAQ